ncbi:arcadin 1 [Candidatus Hecatella orcuttiae]|jgi:hypothetical protein|uniref:arcadin 1 n=1 Tax=Candidatus Hecatella orcuttiae TaxID=1935119 RepID=UPI0028682E44|nr:arcadin 1 [Candidatus Hecatella orcuttiae]
MGSISIICKVNAIHPSAAPFGGEFVCVEFAVEAQKPPSFIQIPKDIPQEVSAVMPILTQLPKMLPQVKPYNNRLVLYLTPQEWEKLPRKYQYGDEVEIKINPDGSIHVSLI